METIECERTLRTIAKRRLERPWEVFGIGRFQRLPSRYVRLTHYGSSRCVLGRSGVHLYPGPGKGCVRDPGRVSPNIETPGIVEGV